MVESSDDKQLDSGVPDALTTLHTSLSEGDLRSADANLEQYLITAIRMYEAIRNNPERYAKFKRMMHEQQKQTTAEE